jgi:hypothetical protein
MAIRHFLGKVKAVAQVHGGSIDSVDATPSNNTFTVTIGGVSVTVTGVTSAAATAAALVALLNASTHPYFAAITWTNPSAGNIVGTGDVAGMPFVAALTKAGAGTGTVTDFSATTAATGPNDLTNAANWSADTLPTAGDTVVFDDPTKPVLGADVSGWGTLALMKIEKFNGEALALLAPNKFCQATDGGTYDTTVPEYRTRKVTINVSRTECGDAQAGDAAGGPGRAVFDLENVACVLDIFGTGASLDAGLPAFRFVANTASTHLYVRGGSVGVAMDAPTDTATIGNVQVHDAGQGTKVTIGAGTTWTNFEQTAGDNLVRAAADATKITIRGGTLRTEGDFDVAVDALGGTYYPNHLKTGDAPITTLTINGGAVDATQCRTARTWDAVVFSGLGSLKYDKSILTITALTMTREGMVSLAVEDAAAA